MGETTVQPLRMTEIDMGPLELRMRQKIEAELRPLHYELLNESHQHSVPAQSETHFKLIVVSASFEGLSRLQRSRLVYDLLGAELRGGVHALTQKTLTPKEYQDSGAVVELESPSCQGGSKAIKT